MFWYAEHDLRGRAVVSVMGVLRCALPVIGRRHKAENRKFPGEVATFWPPPPGADSRRRTRRAGQWAKFPRSFRDVGERRAPEAQPFVVIASVLYARGRTGGFYAELTVVVPREASKDGTCLKALLCRTEIGAGAFMELKTRRFGDWIVLVVGGDKLDAYSAERFHQGVMQLLSDDAAKVLIDLSAVKSTDSYGLGELLLARQRVRLTGRSFALCGLQPAVQAAMRVTRLDSVFEIVETPELAAEKAN